ncbi:hypothetical protein COV53_06550 [Candidatus Gottesmanbacteria bacterium CG11_big_fil_rev_8_21_14_0_20_37_11]|uniref:Transcobalamin-like C-terminal domain-containing protein n=3 Tax=Candidatus Gottesmaniibacteriota TaxID=1752720 RepID=A0A2M7RQA0_9BACT|nr:MAG: hypothetical protein AUJ73_00995 [Candidatus Gottesmanbacteria bacterium CG1_02_37_22]PIP32956.1 MAG: hypothetical protein COX23_01680 [Candidatus Gottesmanbacteria bacterium CG23_combo_of_CG06-09_8_20_14_all_37_19]PIR07753.1 MAG: hypothetical protein COV53_06550 [Candidatus Gottesmanbacteria bacterium CG11_big_fil_rev_8_21_14_0_20_37_11]PIZ02350.1 MAG: hypothetical protein COY59_05020 [Candidatus Gottesmanbacteria bacterium CG_4_10_14_0_8_um_filter_37_24]
MIRKNLIKIIIIASIFLFVGATLSLRGGNYYPDKSNSQIAGKKSGPKIISPTEIPEKTTEKVVIDFGDGNIITGEVKANNAYESLVIASKDSGLEIFTKEYDFGLMVTSIGGKQNSNEKAWMYSVNDRSGDKSADQYIIKPGDTVEWKYSSF